MENKKDKKQSAEEEKLFSDLEFSYSRSKEEVWNVLNDMMGQEPAEDNSAENSDKDVIQMRLERESDEPAKVRSINWRRLSIAASLALLLSTGLLVRFYSRTIAVAPGEFVSHTLPDGSEVHLNAATTISYKPFWWRMERAVELEGEAYFVVAKGEQFTVNTALGNTAVLGTEFNVYARGDDFQVYCEEGRVRVSSDIVVEGTQDTVILKAGELAIVELNHLSTTLVKQVEAVPEANILSWRAGRFIYNTTPLSKVFEDIERHYGVTVSLDNITIENDAVTASFNRGISVENALGVVCIPVGLEFTKIEEGVYLIKRK